MSLNSIPDDLINGIPISQMMESTVVTSNNKANNYMIHDGSLDCMQFQQNIKSHAHKYARMYGQNKTNVLVEPRRMDELPEVPNSATLTKKVRISMIRCHQSTPKNSCDSWNEMF